MTDKSNVVHFNQDARSLRTHSGFRGNTSSTLPGIRSLSSIWQGLGDLFNGNRNIYDVFGWRQTITYKVRYDKYRRQGIAARIVDAEPNATWSNPPVITAQKPKKVELPKNNPEPNSQSQSQEPGATESPPTPNASTEAKTNTARFDKAWNDLLAKHPLWSILNRADKLAGMGRYSILVFGFRGGKLDTPLTSGGGGDLLYVQPYCEENAQIKEYEEDQNNPRFGQPKLYSIKPFETTDGVSKPVLKSRAPEILVHWSRVIHIAENTLEDSIMGVPRLDKVFNDLDDLQKTTGGAAETFWLTSNRGVQIDVDKDMQLSSDDVAALQDEVDDYTHNLSRIMRTRGVTVKDLGSDVADPRGTFDVIISLIAGASGIPKRILMGSEAGQLASEQDRANWAVHIEERRVNFAEPIILIPTIKLLIFAGILPTPQQLYVKWPEAFKMSPLERAQASAQKARTLANVAKALSDTQPPITLDEGRQMIGISDTVPLFDDTGDSKL